MTSTPADARAKGMRADRPRSDLCSAAASFLRALLARLRRALRGRARSGDDPGPIEAERDQLLATISHELRAPLNCILGWAQTLRDGAPAPETLRRGLAQIESSARAQAKVIDELLGVQDLATVAPPGARKPGRRDLSGLRILAVDDDASTREMLQQVFENAGAEVLLAGSVREALSKIQRFGPHALVSDIGMPHEDGYELLRQVRALPPERGGATPAIALTAYTREKDRAATRDAGYQAVAAKPVDLDELFAAIVRVAAR
jgi:CheY-like chemotaxis protein